MLGASRIFLRELEHCIAAHQDFAIETTLAGRGYLQLVQRLRANDWRVELIYLALPSLQMSKLRVAERVVHGGHNIPASDLERRFARSLRHLLNDFSYQVNNCTCIMNGGERSELVFEQSGNNRNIIHAEYYQHLMKEATQ